MFNSIKKLCENYKSLLNLDRIEEYPTGFSELDKYIHLQDIDSVLILSKYRNYTVDLPIKLLEKSNSRSICFSLLGDAYPYAITERLLSIWYKIPRAHIIRGTAPLEEMMDPLDDLSNKRIVCFSNYPTQDEIVKYVNSENKPDVLCLIDVDRIRKNRESDTSKDRTQRIKDVIPFLKEMRRLATIKKFLFISSISLEYDYTDEEIKDEDLEIFNGIEESANVILAPFIRCSQNNEGSSEAIIRILKSHIGPERDIPVSRDCIISSFIEKENIEDGFIEKGKNMSIKKKDIQTVCNEITNKEENTPRKKEVRISNLYNDLEIEAGDFCLISGRPAMGKTSTVITMIENKPEKKIGVVTFSESARCFTLKILSRRTNMPLKKITSETDSRKDIKNEVEKLSNKSNITFYEIDHKITDNELLDYITQIDCDILVIEGIDYLLPGEIYENRMTYDDLESKYNCGRAWRDDSINSFYDRDRIAIDPSETYLEEFVNKVKAIGKEKGHSILGTINHPRVADYRFPDFLPELSDLRRWGRLDLAIDICIFPFRYEYYDYFNELEDYEKNEADIFIAKSKGAAPYYPVIWDRNTLQFLDKTIERPKVCDEKDFHALENDLDSNNENEDEDIPF